MCMWQKSLISNKAKKLFTIDLLLLATWYAIVYRVFSQLWLTLSLGHLYNSNVVQKRWPSDKANHSCEKYSVNYCMYTK